MRNEETEVLVTGATGTLGQALVDQTISAGHHVRIMSRREAPDGLLAGRSWVQADLVTAENLDASVDGIDVIIHAATDYKSDPQEVDVEGTRRLLDVAERSSVRHLIFPSIVGIDRMPYFYYEAKLEVEEIVAESEIPHTTVRITQFHSFVDEILSAIGKSPVMPLPTRALLQTISVEEAAEHLVRLVTEESRGRLPDVAGPEVLELGQMARGWAHARGKRRWIVRLPVPGELARGFREGRATVPDRAIGTETWRRWLLR